MSIKIGIGYDLHKLVVERELFLGGVKIDFEKGLLGHSDGDVLLHTICDGLLGACGEGDIGMHFPDKNKEFKDIRSTELLKRTYDLLKEKHNLKIINIDTVVICDEPKLTNYRDDIKKVISEILHINTDIINIKAKTTENTSIDTIAAYAAVLVEVK